MHSSTHERASARHVSGPIRAAAIVVLLLLATTSTSCGGGGGGPNGDAELVLVSFLQGGIDNIQLNTVLKFKFSSEINAATVTRASIQVRQGGEFGLTVPGEFRVSGANIEFRPALASLCDQSDGGLKGDTVYRVQFIGHPEEFAIKNVRGVSLSATSTHDFSTRPETDPELYRDDIPGQAPFVTSTTPASGTAAIDVGTRAAPERIVIEMSEGIDPCSVSLSNVTVEIAEVGGPFATSVTAPNGNLSGFVTGGSDVTDRSASPLTWGSDTGTPWPSGLQTLPISVYLQQDFDSSRIIVSPLRGQDPLHPERGGIFPENVLLVVSLGLGINDFGGQPVAPMTVSYTTENLDASAGIYVIANDGETPYDTSFTTADVDSARAPSVAQAFLLFAGDGDNGGDMTKPSGPATDSSGCSGGPFQANDFVRDDFKPTSDQLLDTGPINSCQNGTDGSTAVVWEFSSITIPNGVTVRLKGSNPAVFLVSGQVTIEAGGRLLARGDAGGGAPQGRGGKGVSTTTAGSAGGSGVAGGGGGGSCLTGNGTAIPKRYSGSGLQGYFMNGASVDASVFAATGVGGGRGNTSVRWNSQTYPQNRNSVAGGGGGQITAGADGSSLGTGAAPTSLDLTLSGLGGAPYDALNTRLTTPVGGSGGGAAGEVRPFSGNAGRGTGGAGGAGGGFIGITAGGSITILGTIDCAGSPGGDGATQPFNPNYTQQPGTGGGGGGSGGGIRLLTPKDITLGPLTTLTTAGGGGGAGGQAQQNVPPVNPGGRGADGRIVLEDSNAEITGLVAASLVPTEGEAGFYRGVFDPTRFKGGGLSPFATTEPILMGPFDPQFSEPIQSDFVAGVPTMTSPGIGEVAVLVEARGFEVQLDGLRAPTGPEWRTIGHMLDSGVENAPTWVGGHPAGLARTLDNIGTALIDNLASLNGNEYIQFRFTFYLSPLGISATDPGAFLDDWTIRFTSDN